MIDCAKISGIMPTGLTFIGMCVLAAAVLLAPAHALAILHRNAPHAFLNEDDDDDADERDEDEQRRC